MLKKKHLYKILLASILWIFSFSQINAQSFPLKISSDSRHLETRYGKPFFIIACSFSLTQEPSQIPYSLNRLSNNGINTLFVNISGIDSAIEPKQLPASVFFRKVKTLKRLIKEAAFYKLVVIIYPQKLRSSSSNNKEDDCNFLFEKLGKYKNVLWLMDQGDFYNSSVVNTKQLKALFLKSENYDCSAVKPDFIVSENMKALNRNISKPIVVIDNVPEKYSDTAAYKLREKAYSGILQWSSGIIMNQPVLAAKKWLANNPFYYHLMLFKNIFDTIQWQFFKPFPGIINSKDGISKGHFYSALNSGTSEIALYYSLSEILSLDLSTFRSNVKLTWIQPSSGKVYYSQVTPKPNEQLFLPPNTNSRDWLLIIKEEK